MKNQHRYLMLIVTLLYSVTSYSTEYNNIEFADSVVLPGTEQELVLNGIGMRTKFVFDVYIGALYIEKKANSRNEVQALTGPKRVLMHFVYDEVSAEKLVSAWNEGFEDNNDEQALVALKDRIETFNAMFTTVKAGDIVLLDYVPGKGTVVTIKGEQKGVIEGGDFNKALLDIWLGEEPADDDLKDSMLGQE